MKLDLTEFEEVEYASRTPREDAQWILIEEGTWEQNGKYQSCSRVVQNIESKKFYKYELERVGSPFTDWEYTHDNEGCVYLSEVEQKNVVTTVWAYV